MSIQDRRDTTAVLLLLLVFLSILRPVTPYISDAVAHSFYSERHHAMMHAAGINHVDEELKKINETNRKAEENAMPSSFSIDNSFVFFIAANEFLFFRSIMDLCFSKIFSAERSAIISPAFQPPDQMQIILHF